MASRVRSLRASAPRKSIGLRYRGRYFILATRHQLINLGVEEKDTGNVGQLVLGMNKVVTCSGFFRYGTKDDYRADDRYDVVAFFYDDQIGRFPELRCRFLEIDHAWDVDTGLLVECFAVGCAFCDQIVDFNNDRLHVARQNRRCRYLGPTGTRGLRRVEDAIEGDFDPDGMSGGAIMFIRNDLNWPKIEFGGMIQRGGGGFYQYIDAQQLILFLDSAISIHFANTG